MFGVLGCRTVIQIGNCGGLTDGLNAGDIFVATKAYCGEGAAQYYKTDGPWVQASENLLNSQSLLQLRNEGFRAGPIFTTGALFAEGLDDVERWATDGFDAVDMETATTFAVAESFGMDRISILYVFDNPRRRDHLLQSDVQKDVLRTATNERVISISLSLADEVLKSINQV
jgi:purine-nucleoside phosphorylase